MLGQPSSVPGFEVAAASVADRADPARRRAAQLRHPQRHARRRHRSGPAAVARRSADLARRPRRRRLGHAQGPRLPHRAVPPCPPQGSSGMLNLAEYRKKTTAPCRLPALGVPGRARHRPQQGRLLPAHPALPRPRPRQRHRGRAGRHHGPAQQCPEALRLRAGPCSSRPSACRPTSTRARASPILPPGWSIRSAMPPSAPTARTTRAATI